MYKPGRGASPATCDRRTVTLADMQARPIDDQSGSHVLREAQAAKTHARRIHRKHAQAQQGAHEAEAEHAEPIHTSAQSEQSDDAGSTGNPRRRPRR